LLTVFLTVLSSFHAHYLAANNWFKIPKISEVRVRNPFTFLTGLVLTLSSLHSFAQNPKTVLIGDERWVQVLLSKSQSEEGWRPCIARLVQSAMADTPIKDVATVSITSWNRFTPRDYRFTATDSQNNKFSGQIRAEVDAFQRTDTRTGNLIEEGYHCGYYRRLCGTPENFILRNAAGQVIHGAKWDLTFAQCATSRGSVRALDLADPDHVRALNAL
jgi:hypothetical protein